ncbi:MAG: hypothetical protein ACXVFM_16660 [Solirubrobacteraceae bacterium]
MRHRNGDELTDGLDEVICPYDMDWDRRTYILDDELDEIFADLSPEVLLEVVLRLLVLGCRRAWSRAGAQTDVVPASRRPLPRVAVRYRRAR